MSNKKTKKHVWRKNTNNSVLDGDGFFISFNTNPCCGFDGFESDNNSSETALVNRSSDIAYRILNGDFRQEYEAVIDDGWDACLAVYEKHETEHRSSWTA